MASSSASLPKAKYSLSSPINLSSGPGFPSTICTLWIWKSPSAATPILTLAPSASRKSLSSFLDFWVVDDFESDHLRIVAFRIRGRANLKATSKSPDWIVDFKASCSLFAFPSSGRFQWKHRRLLNNEVQDLLPRYGQLSMKSKLAHRIRTGAPSMRQKGLRCQSSWR